MTLVNKPAWVDLSSTDPAGSREFYAKLLGWEIEVSPDPQYGGYAIGRMDGQDVAGIGPQQAPGAPSAWSLYIGSDDAAATGRAVEAAGGTVVMPAFDVGDQGRMAVFQDPSGAFISAWQASGMSGFGAGGAGRYGWAELNARGLESVLPFYAAVFGWSTSTSPMGEGMGDYTQFETDGESIAGAMEMNPGIPAEVPSYWMIYFNAANVDDSYARALELGATEMVAPTDFPGGRFAIVSDPQGAMFGLLSMR
jgi:predicted enzyme related to lactoylglutathione lyase